MRRSSLIAVVLAVFASFSPLAAQDGARELDWDAINKEAVGLLSDYLKINTSNPPGNEMLGIQWLKGVLEKEGFEVQVFDTAKLGATRGNLYTRLKGNGSKKAIALVHHVDVVPATPSYWSVDPFSGLIKDGYVYGRGALDMKGEGLVHLMAMLALKRAGVQLNRDIVYIANADEELTSTGAIEFVAAHPDLVRDVEFLITEGGDNPVRNGRLEYFGVSVAEKRTFWQKLTVKGTPSHGSRPTKQNPVPRLIAAVHKIAQYETPLRVTPGVAKYFRDISATYPGQQRVWLSDVRAAIRDPRARTWLTNDVYWNAILRNTITPTGLYGSDKTNVIPPEASAVIDIRLLPDQNADSMLATLKRIVNDTAVTFQTLLAPKTPLENPIDTDLFRAIEKASKERNPQALVTTPMLTGATDRPTYRKVGIITYGLDPFLVESSDSQRGVHGNDERISVENLGFGVKYVYDILRYVQ